MERFKPDELERRVDEVLFYFWDSIGINSYVSARAEYRSYVPKVLVALESGGLDKVINLLMHLEKYMGLEPQESNAQKVGNLLFSHKDAIEKGHA
ncbi:hypothetical protein ACOMICROBIO_LKFPLAJE_01950 [Vibrio sp. B1FIG11]|uniref:hypothetical protein n=1 Tax=Vibrio sp. B1FIG11 TaxID=2751177 RepID=UPI0015F6B2D4|nr:hypothetical protein [Vibrio sp. B1FIG11]CAE6909298.1 hypothetical protein ACOMICROBIO_LKFPLAJE_01950 [Vibrio sp. B1FIG11]